MSQSWWKVLGLAMGLPSLIIGAFFGLNALVGRGLISWPTALIVLLLIIGNTLFWMVRFGFVGKNKS